MAQETVFINFEVDYTELKNAQAEIAKTGKVDTKGFDAIQSAINETATDTKGLIKQFKEVGSASVKMGKSVEDAFGAGVQDALDQAGVSVEEFASALKKTNAPTITLKKELAQLKESLARMKAEGKDTGKEFESLRQRAGKLADSIADANAEIKNAGSDTRGIDNVVGSISALAGGYAAVQGAAALFGDESEDLQKTLVQVNGAMALAQGIQTVYNATLKEGALAKLADSVATGTQTAALRIYEFVTGGATTATKLLRAAIVATGIGAFVVLLVSAYQAMSSFGDNTKDTTEDLRKFNIEIENNIDLLDRFITSQNNASDIAIEKAKQRGATEAQVNKIVVNDLRKNAAETDKVLRGNLNKLNDFADEVGSKIGVSLGANAFQRFNGRGATAYEILQRIQSLRISGEFDKLGKSAQESVTSLEEAATKVNNLSEAVQNLNNKANLREQQSITKGIEDARKRQDERDKKALEAKEKADKDALEQARQTDANFIKSALERANKEIEAEQIAYDNKADIDAQTYETKKKNAKDWDDQWKAFQESLVKTSEDAADKLKKQAAEEKRIQEQRIKQLQTYLEVGVRVASIFAELARQQSDRDLQAIASQRRVVDEQLKAGAITQKAAEQRNRKLDDQARLAQQRAAEREKRAAVFVALLAIPKAFLQGLSQGGIYLAAVYAALAAAEAAVISSRPVPKFFRGKKDRYEGPGVVADMGSEIVERGGRMFLYTKPTQTYLGANDKVYTAAETRNIMHNTNINTTVKPAPVPAFDYDRLGKAIPRDAISINIDKEFISESVASGLAKNNYFNKRYQFKK